MGDGGVACVPSQHLMERFPITETFCGGNGGFSSKSLQYVDSSRKSENKMEVAGRETGSGKTQQLDLENGKTQQLDLENGEIVPANSTKADAQRGEIIAEKVVNGDIEKGEIVLEKSSKWEIENGEIPPESWQKGELEKGEFVPDKWQGRDKEELVGRGKKYELEKGEFVPVKWRKSEVVKEEYFSERVSKLELEKGEILSDKGGKDRGRANTDDLSLSKKKVPASRWDSSREAEHSNSTERRKRSSSRWEASQEKETRSSSRAVEEPSSHKTDHPRKSSNDYSDHSGSKIRRLSDDNNRSIPDKLHSRNMGERSYRNSSSSSTSSRVSSSGRCSSRHHDKPHSSRGARNRHGRSPSYLERSPLGRTRHHDRKDRSPERSPHERIHHRDPRGRSPGYSERSPWDRGKRPEHRDQNPANAERSSCERGRHRDRSPASCQQSPRGQSHHHGYRDRTPQHSPHRHGRTTNRKSTGCEKPHSRNEKKSVNRDVEKDSNWNSVAIQLHDSNCHGNKVENHSHKDKEPEIPATIHVETLLVTEAQEDLASMEEDMDICDTPPHEPAVNDSNLGKWFYLDHCGVEQGPSKLCDLRRLVEEGALQSDHLVKHLESDRWVTVENAASPVIPANFLSIVSDNVTQLVNPPEASGNLLVDLGDLELHANGCSYDEYSVESIIEDFQIDERVEFLMEGHSLVAGKELEALGGVLGTTFELVEWEQWNNCEGFSRFRRMGHSESSVHSREKDVGRVVEIMPKETAESRFTSVSEKEYPGPNFDLSDWYANLWSCKGGDWKRNDEVAQDRFFKKKVVLNEGYPLCQMGKSGYEDPRRSKKEDLYPPSRIKRLDLPAWAFSCLDDKNDSYGSLKPNQPKPAVARGLKGTTLPVVRINACVVRDHGPVTSDLRPRGRAGEHHSSSRSARSFSSNGDNRGSSVDDGVSRTKSVQEQDTSQALLKCKTVVSIPRDRVCKIDELELTLGEWYYLDGSGHEQGPATFSELQKLAEKGAIQKHSSVFRKSDKLWVPITSLTPASEPASIQEEKENPVGFPSSNSFHSLHPQFVGYTRGKLHELVMKYYRSREFAAAINEVLDPWISAKQPKKDGDMLPFNSSITRSGTLAIHELPEDRIWKSEDDSGRFGKRSGLLFDVIEEEEMDEDMQMGVGHDDSFEALCEQTPFHQENSTSMQSEAESWGLMDGFILARVFHHLRTDFKALAFSAATCKSWNRAIKVYRSISTHVNFLSLGAGCNDTIFRDILKGYDKAKLKSVILRGCKDVSAAALEELLHSFPTISSVDVIGCSQFRELYPLFKNVKWIRTQVHNLKPLEETHSKMRSLKQLSDRSYSSSKACTGADSCNLDFSFDRKDSTGPTFHQTSYKRRKLLGARKPSAVLSREAQIRQLRRRKSERGYKRIEEFLALSLKDIMRDNTFDLFVPKVAKIENRMRNGYYIGHGLSSIKDDIGRICRDAIKAKRRGDAGNEINHIVMLFIQLAASLEENSTLSHHEREEMIKSLKDSSLLGFSLADTKYRKKHNKVMGDRKSARSIDYREYASDREIRRRLNKLNKKALDFESESSDDLGPSEEDGRVDGETTGSDTESDQDSRSGSAITDARGDGLSAMEDDSLNCISDEREWGARMTKAGLVPPVTRKYDVIDHYVVVADEEEVQRKMRVSLPDDYDEKLKAQKSSNEDADMDFPEVKDYKPRKKLGDEALEQEVYGIDPYTHNLLLDSMPTESPEWPLSEKHMFIEEVLLRTLNKQVRHFTGAGNTPMMYPLRPVIEEILQAAEADADRRITKMCQTILKEMQSRPEDNYVAYRKGLGVVCNKEGGFPEDDFVVEFLGEVYPTWRWFEKQDGIRALQKNDNDPAPEFYNIYLERPKGDRDGYDLVVVDAMHKANYASRICHSCRPNCEAKVAAVDGQYQIGIYTLRPIGYGEEITFDYNSVTESKEEYEASVCLCGSQVCRGSYLNLTGEGAFQKVLKECHGILDRHQLMLEACELNSVSEEDLSILGRAGLGTCLLSGLPDWLIAYSASLVRFINIERTKLPEEILNYNLEEKRKFFSDISLELEKSDAEIQAEGVFNQRVQNLALTLDKVRYVMRRVFGDPKLAPPPLERLAPKELVKFLWKGEDSLVEELLRCMAPHMEEDLLHALKFKIQARDLSVCGDPQRELRKSLLWLRDEIRSLPCSYKCRNDAAADLIHLYAYTKCFFRVREYKTVTSEPVYISPLDLGPKYMDKMGTGFQEYCKIYRENYCLGKLIYWHDQAHADPDCNWAKAIRGCLSLPDIASFYVKFQKLPHKPVYGPRFVKFMLTRMEKQPQRPWPGDHIWQFKSSPQIFGSPMMDAVLKKSSLDKEMVNWLKNRPAVYQTMWDR